MQCDNLGQQVEIIQQTLKVSLHRVCLLKLDVDKDTGPGILHRKQSALYKGLD